MAIGVAVIAAGAAGLTWWYFNTKKEGKSGETPRDEDLELAELLKLARKLKKGKKKKTLKKSTATETEEEDEESITKPSPRTQQNKSSSMEKKKVVVPTLNLEKSH
jgi:hypothetical protein